MFVDVSMKTWRVSLALRPSEEVCRGKLGVGGNYVWCLVIAILWGLEVQRGVEREALPRQTTCEMKTFKVPVYIQR